MRREMGTSYNIYIEKLRTHLIQHLVFQLHPVLTPSLRFPYSFKYKCR